jgi:hypothetical protein
MAQQRRQEQRHRAELVLLAAQQQAVSAVPVEPVAQAELVELGLRVARLQAVLVAQLVAHLEPVVALLAVR